MSEENNAVSTANSEVSTQELLNQVADAAQGTEEVSSSTAEASTEPKETVVEKKEEQKDQQKKDDFSSKFAALSRRDKLLRQKEAEIANKQLEFEKKIKEYEEKLKTYGDLEEQLKLNPLKALKEKYGKSYEDLTQIALNEGNPTPEMILQRIREEIEAKTNSRIEELTKKLEEKEKREADEEYQQKEQNFLKDLTNFVNTNKEKYELVVANNAVDMIYDVMKEHYNKTLELEGEGRTLSYEEAAEQVEKHFEEELEKYVNLQKIKKKFAESSDKKPAVKEPNSSSGQSVTLTNTLSQQAPKADRKLSNEESIKEVAKLLRWNE
jgi:hypothetical protein